MSARTIGVRAHAKINLALHIGGVRRDGYHELRTIFQSVSLHDTLTFSAARGRFAIECTDPACPTDRTNLVWTAAEAVWRAAGWRGAPRDVAVHITKRIPLQSGLGGGSSDAAAAIRACAALWKVKLDRDQLQAIAAKLGADVPYFLEGGTVLGLGRGDALFPLTDRPPAWVTIVIPSFGVSTKDAFKWWDAGRSGRPGGSGGSGRPGRSGLSDVDNDLESAVGKHHPLITRLVRALKRLGSSHAGMSGSGSAVFGLFDSRRRADDAGNRLSSRGRRVLVARTINRDEYQLQSAAFRP